MRIVRSAAKPRRWDAACCIVLVMKGGAGRRRTSLRSTFVTVKEEERTACSTAWASSAVRNTEALTRYSSLKSWKARVSSTLRPFHWVSRALKTGGLPGFSRAAERVQ
ncbi:MAG: hypothetical protein FD126_2887 [Elusimicrobia bacterium]|nr:MAG: hypothetical protein FD126_2887 [Elusimicrobiota bacterium]